MFLKISTLAAVLVTIVVTVFALHFWSGSSSAYLAFSFTFVGLAYFALKKCVSAGFVILSGAMFIGYWLKLSIHVILPDMPWMEPIGSFVDSGPAWDHVVNVVSVGALAVLLAGLLASRTPQIKRTAECAKASRKMLWILWLTGYLLLACVIIFNEKFDVLRTPVSPRTLDLPWPMQALFNWFLTTGGLTFLLLPFYLHIRRAGVVIGTVLLVMASAAVGISIYSRGTVVFESLIVLAAFYVYKDKLPHMTKTAMVKIFLIILLGVVATVLLSQDRRQSFDDRRLSTAELAVESGWLTAHSLYLIFKLPLERWVGLEGVMAVSAYDEKGTELMVRGITERRTVGPVDMYTSKIALSPTPDTNTVMYASPPGVIAFLYYSNSLSVVFAGMFICTLFMIYIENLLMRFSGNPFLASAIGSAAAIQLIHTGTGGLWVPAQMFGTTLLFCVLLALFSRKFLERASGV